MLKFNHAAENIVESFGVSDADKKRMDEVFEESLANRNKTTDDSTVTWIIQRFWIDEILSDNAKVYLTFMLGRWYEKSTGPSAIIAGILGIIEKKGEKKRGRNRTNRS